MWVIGAHEVGVFSPGVMWVIGAHEVGVFSQGE